MLSRSLGLVFLLTLTFIAFAQPGSGPGSGPGGGGPPAPIGGLEYLIGGGALLAYRYFRKQKKD